MKYKAFFLIALIVGFSGMASIPVTGIKAGSAYVLGFSIALFVDPAATLIAERYAGWR